MVTNSLRMECIRNQSRNRNCSRYLCMHSPCEEQDETVDSSVLKVGVILFTATPHWRRGYLEISSKITLRLSTRFLFLGDSETDSERRFSGAWSSLGRTSVVWNHLIQNESHAVYVSGGRC